MWAPPKELPVPDEILLHSQSDAVLAIAPVPRKPPAAKSNAAAATALSATTDAVDELAADSQVTAPTAKRRRPTKADRPERIDPRAESAAAGNLKPIGGTEKGAIAGRGELKMGDACMCTRF